MSKASENPNYKPVSVAMRIAGMEFAGTLSRLPSVEVFKLAFFLGAVAANEAGKKGLASQLESELAIFKRTGCTCGHDDCEKLTNPEPLAEEAATVTH